MATGINLCMTRVGENKTLENKTRQQNNKNENGSQSLILMKLQQTPTEYTRLW